VSAEDSANVWNAVRDVREEKDVVFIPGVIRRLRLLDPTTPITADTWGDGRDPGQGVFPVCGGVFRWLGEGCLQAVRLGVARGIIPQFLSVTAVSQMAFSGLAAPQR
jgi:hypothetical protein